MREVDADYYGYRDDDDGILVQFERVEEKKGIKISVTRHSFTLTRKKFS